MKHLVYQIHTTLKKYCMAGQKEVMRGNDVVLKLHEKLDKVFVMLKIELFT